VAVAIALAIFASGSRGTLLAVTLGIPCLLFLAWRKIRRDQNIRFSSAVGPLLVIGGVIAVLVAVSSTTLFGLFLSRVSEAAGSVERPVGTIELRLVLWTAAWKAWLTSPLVGIGIGNFDLVDQIVPEMRMTPVWYYIRGMSAHNVVLHYLAETGLVGVLALLSVPLAGVRTVRHFIRARLNPAETQVSMALAIAVIVFAMSLFFMRAWTWAQEGHVMAMILGMTAAWHYQQTNRTT
jgi:O-antigen ligase